MFVLMVRMREDWEVCKQDDPILKDLEERVIKSYLAYVDYLTHLFLQEVIVVDYLVLYLLDYFVQHCS